ncbi:MAG TPA: D-2-hydroxyacid dehydrogenase family protein [Actinocrinis sp.]|nr:D-2-hydroxyacid dehydrogenase family protein [Actinocrinis sp.]
MTRVAVLDDYQGRAREYADWGSLGDDVDVEFFRSPIAEDALAETLAGFEILVLMRERTAFPRRVLERLPALRLVITTGMGNASVDLAYLRERGIPMAGTQGASAGAAGVSSTTEVAWALIFAATKRVTIEDRALRAGVWQRGLPGTLAGATLGLAGLGRLGSEMVGPARAFGMDVIAWSTNLSGERAAEVGVERVTKEELLRRSDVLSIHLVLGGRSRGLFGAADLAQMKRTAVVVNTSRGPIIDEAALVDALTSGTIAAAGLDVYDREPLPADHPLLKVENAVLLPHLGYANEATFRVMYGQVVEDIRAFLSGSPVRVIP